MFGDKTSFSKMIGFSCLSALSMLLVSTRIERPAFASANLAADTMKLNPTSYLTADNDGDDDDDCNKTRKADYSLTNNKNDELTAITGAMTPTSAKVTF